MTKDRVDKEIIESEKSVLSSILYHFSDVESIVNIDLIEEDHFVTDNAKKVFRAIKNTTPSEKEYDFLLVSDSLKRICVGAKEFEQRVSYLNDLSEDIHYFSINKYLQILKIYRVKNSLNRLSEEIFNKAVTLDNFEDLITEWKEKFERAVAVDSVTGYTSAKEAIMQFKALVNDSHILGKSNFLRTGYKDVDNRLKALLGGQLVIIASRPGVGKTTFALNIISNNLNKDKQTKHDPWIGIFSLEMPNSLLLSKLIAIEAKVKLSQVQRKLDGDFIDAADNLLIDKAQEQISTWNVLFCDEANITVGKIISTIKAWCQTYNLKLVIIDYLQLINYEDSLAFNSMNQYQKIGIISRRLKVLAMEMNICIVSLAQLNRKMEERRGADKSPILSDLRESGSIEQDADVVMFLYEEAENKSNDRNEFPEDDLWNEAGVPKTMMKIAKNRNGPVGKVEFQFDKAYGIYKLSE